MDGIFINYRREDSAPYTGRLYDFLQQRFPDRKVFMDIDGIAPGEDFVVTINRTLDSSRVVLAVIGPHWLDIQDERGNRRLDNSDDFIVRELSAALSSTARVIPILVGGVRMPQMDSLPQALRALARRNAIEISDSRFPSDAERLSAAILQVIEPSAVTLPTAHADMAATASPPQRADASAPADVKTLRAVLWTAYALEVLSVLHTVIQDESLDQLAFGGILLILLPLLNIMLLSGKNWARITYTTLVAVCVPLFFLGVHEQSSADKALNIATTLLEIWAICMMFTHPVKSNFKSK